MKYAELAEVLNQDTEALEALSGQKGALVRMTQGDNGQMVQEIDPQVEKDRDEFLRKTRRVVYPMYLLGFFVSGVLYVAYEEQAKLIDINSKKIMNKERRESY